MKKYVSIVLLGLMLFFSACGAENRANSEYSDSEPSGSFVHAENETHADKDGNDLCDDCGESVAVTFDLFALNDLHGKLADGDNHIGADELSAYLKAAKAENENTVLLSSGDMWQGSSESNLTKGLIMTEWMNEMDFVSMTLGNHEYDWGVEYIENNAEAAEFPFLAINVYERATDGLAEYCQPSVIVEKSGVKIGIIGAIGDCYSSISADKVQDVYFKIGDELTELVKAESLKLRQAGADCIIYSLHDGYGQSFSEEMPITESRLSGYYDIELSKGYVDLVFEGHTHQSYVLKDTEGVYHLQNGGDNDGISHAEVKINFANGTSVVREAEFVEAYDYETLTPDPIVDELLEKYEAQISVAGKELGYNGRYRSGNELREIVAGLYYDAGMEKWGEEYDIVLGGGYMSVRSPYNLQTGQVLYGDLMSIFPFDNALVLCSIPGEYLLSQFFETGNSNYFIAYGDYGASVWENIDEDATYYIVTDTYSSQYAPNHLTEIERYDDTTFARDLLAAYIEEGGLES